MRARFILPLLLLAAPAEAQMFALQQDANGVPVQDFLRFGSPHSVAMTNDARDMEAFNDSRTRFVLITCTSACNIQQKTSPARAASTDFQLPANTVLRLRVQPTDGLSFRAASGTAWIVELN